MSEFIYRKTTDDNFEHCAVTLLPFCVAAIQTLSELNLKPEKGVKRSDLLNAIQITAEVALALSIEKYGKPRIRVHAATRPTPEPVDE